LEQAAALAEGGFPFVEISVLSAEAFQRDLEQLSYLQNTQGIIFLAHGPEEGKAQDPGFLKNEMLPRINRITECLPELGIELLTIHFWLDRRFIEPRIIDQKIALLRSMAEHAAAQGVQLCVENLSEQAQDFKQAFDEIEPLGMTLDIGHSELLSEKNTAYDFLAQYPEKIYHMHVHDNQGGSDQSDDLHLLPGQGIIGFRPILKAAGRQGYNRTMTLEVEPDHAHQGRQYIQKLWDAVNPPERIEP
jgi:sugar phosphate isomerase/epimerase